LLEFRMDTNRIEKLSFEQLGKLLGSIDLVYKNNNLIESKII